MRWVCSIALFMIFSGIILELIADTKYYKFAKWVAGTVLLLQFIKPFSQTDMIHERLVASFGSFEYALGTDRVLEEIYQADEETESSVLKTYKDRISVQINRILNKNGLRLENVELSVEQDGIINRMHVWARYLDGMEPDGIRIPTVAPVSITEVLERKTVTPMELYIRETLAEFYQIEENKIEVVIQEAE